MPSIVISIYLSIAVSAGPFNWASPAHSWLPSAVQQPDPTDSSADTDEDDLAEKLIRQSTGQADRGVMGWIQRLMERSAGSLSRDFDPGATTQATQRKIISKLDDAIAAAQRNRSRSKSSGQQSGDKRKSKPKSKKQGRQQDGSAAGQASGDTTGSGSADDTRIGGDPRFKESRRGWGHLPARDRDEVLQGIGESVLEKYRTLIDRYFQALAEDVDRERE